MRKQGKKRSLGQCCCHPANSLIVSMIVVLAAVLGGTFGIAAVVCAQPGYVTDHSFTFDATIYNQLLMTMPNIRESDVRVRRAGNTQSVTEEGVTVSPTHITVVVKGKTSQESYLQYFSQDQSETNNGTRTAVLHLRYSGSTSLLLGCPKYEVTIYLPNSIVIAVLSIHSNNANYHVEDAFAYRINLEATIGGIVIRNTHAAQLSALTTTGDISIVNTEIDKDLRARILGYGNMNLRNVFHAETIETSIFGGFISADQISMRDHGALFQHRSHFGWVDIRRLSRGSLDIETNAGNVEVTIPQTFIGTFRLSGSHSVRTEGFNGATLSVDSDNEKVGQVGSSQRSSILVSTIAGSVTLSTYSD